MDLDPEIQAFLDEKCTVTFSRFLRTTFSEKSETSFDSYDLDQAFFPIADDPEKGDLMDEKKQRTKTKFREEYIWEAVSFAGASRVPMNNVNFAAHKRVTEGTIRRWRKENPEFDKAFTNPEMMLANKINHGILSNMDKREKITVIKDKDGVKAIKEEVLPTHNDIMLASKNGFRKSMIGFEEQHRRETLKGIRQRLTAGEITYLDAVDECEEEGVSVAESWKTRETARIIGLKESKELDAVQAVLRLESSGLEVPKLLILEAKKSLGIVDSDAVQPAIIKIVSPGAHIDDDRSD